ncbi:MAG TPA: PAC2 family protein [Methanomassiliicoccaceae archaeon]|jgi:uncharacterized protein|nr:proteasome assembly chaperone family protein [Euryarchaeota archaeon]HOB38417.1 PAC2 family protein [Methanomassiliicoccaceae archaeon]HOQ25711.1 PAC2 family protein [Methanomassiliicoccaceae archaeon]HPP44224.1 PAC2 family protein [Methanomassiliicoccaceae archaeon]HPT74579.1 PAC2 family protein [Methanomassiliicoccaceae archaeon]
MADEVRLHEYRDEKYDGALMIVGFPSVGLVSSIAANFIIRTGKLDRVAGITASGFPPFTLVHEGVPSPPVRIYAGERKCDDGEPCQQIVAVAAEFMPRPDLVQPLVSRLLDYASAKGIKTVVVMEGIDQPGAEEPKILGVGSTNASRDILKKYDIDEMKEGMVSGISGVMLFEGDMRDIDVICLLGPARANFPDARGSAKLLEVIAKMLPEIKIDPEPLFKEAEEIEKQIRMAMQSVEQQKKPTIEESIVYG